MWRRQCFFSLCFCFVFCLQTTCSGQRRKQHGNITVRILPIYKRARERKCIVLGGQIQVNQGSITCHLLPHTPTPTRQSFTARDFPGSLEVRTLWLRCWVAGSILDWGNKIPQTEQLNTQTNKTEKKKKNRNKQKTTLQHSYTPWALKSFQ